MSPGAEHTIRHAHVLALAALESLENAAASIKRARVGNKFPVEVEDIELDLAGCIGTLRLDQARLSELLSTTTTTA